MELRLRGKSSPVHYARQDSTYLVEQTAGYLKRVAEADTRGIVEIRLVPK